MTLKHAVTGRFTFLLPVGQTGQYSRLASSSNNILSPQNPHFIAIAFLIAAQSVFPTESQALISPVYPRLKPSFVPTRHKSRHNPRNRGIHHFGIW